MKLYKVLLVAIILGIISMPARMADLYANVDLGIDNTITAHTSANIAIGNMNTTDWAMAVGLNNTEKNHSIIVGRANTAILENSDQPNTIIGNSSSAEGNGIVIGSDSIATNGNVALNTASLQSTELTFNNSIDGNSSQFGTNGFSSQTHDGRHIEFSSNRIMAGNQQIHNVAKGVDDMDAVNVA